jgi:ATP-dependent RNA helicase DDX46/PRP5
MLTCDAQVPQDLREMLAEFKKKIKEGGAKQHKGSGFGGRGFKFDTSEQVKHERSRHAPRSYSTCFLILCSA